MRSAECGVQSELFRRTQGSAPQGSYPVRKLSTVNCQLSTNSALHSLYHVHMHHLATHQVGVAAPLVLFHLGQQPFPGNALDVKIQRLAA